MSETPQSGGLAAFVVRLAGLWILAGGLFKLFLGTPADLPGIIQDLPLELGLTYKLVIAAEFAIASLALVRPRLAWPILVAVFLLFDAILASQMAAGESSCGCFGADIPIPPWAMMAIDSALLLAILVTKPWRLPRGGLPLALVLVGAALGIVLPFALDREASGPPTGNGDEGEGEEPSGYAILDLEGDVGKSIYDTELAKWIEEDIYSLPPDGLWITWRWTCDHCAEHLERLAQQPPDTPFVVLVRLKEAHDTEANRAVFAMPEGPNVLQANCPDSVEYVSTTPGELRLENAIVVSAIEGVEHE